MINRPYIHREKEEVNDLYLKILSLSFCLLFVCGNTIFHLYRLLLLFALFCVSNKTSDEILIKKKKQNQSQIGMLLQNRKSSLSLRNTSSIDLILKIKKNTQGQNKIKKLDKFLVDWYTTRIDKETWFLSVSFFLTG